MTTTETAIVWIYGVIVAIWPIRLVVLRIMVGRFDWVSPASPGYSGPSPPLVTAILPARNEEENIAECLATLRAQDYPALEIVVADDRSTDRTAAIAREIAARDPRVRLAQVAELPPGWTGKTHAIHRTVPLANGAWLWFVDADTRHDPQSLSVMMEYARIHQAALVSLLPEQLCETFWERVVQPIAGVTLMQSFPTGRIHDPRSSLAFANGQFILVERSAHAAAGGHEAVRDRFVEDVALAGRVKALGKPVRLAFCRGLVYCRMYATLGQLVRGWSRILYDALDRDGGRLLVKLLDPIVFCQSGHLALATAIGLLAWNPSNPFARTLLAMALAHHVFMYLVFRQVHAISSPKAGGAAWFPLGNLIVVVILARALASRFTGRVSWRGDVYRPRPATENPQG